MPGRGSDLGGLGRRQPAQVERERLVAQSVHERVQAANAAFDDSVSYRQGVIWMNDDETGEVLEEVRAALARRAANRPGDGRRPRSLSVIQFPSDHS